MKLEGFDTVLFYTAGGQVINTDLMDEVQRIKTTGMCLLFRNVSFLLTFFLNIFFLNHNSESF